MSDETKLVLIVATTVTILATQVISCTRMNDKNNHEDHMHKAVVCERTVEQPKE